MKKKTQKPELTEATAKVNVEAGVSKPTKWQMANKFMNKQLKQKSFEIELTKYMQKNKFTVDDAEYFCLLLKETMSLYTLIPKLTFKAC